MFVYTVASAVYDNIYIAYIYVYKYITQKRNRDLLKRTF